MPDSIICRAANKSLDHNSSALIKSLLGKPASCEAYTEEEAIIASFLHLGIGPYKIVQGLSLVVVGAILAPIPCVVGTVSTKEYISENNMIASISGVGLQTRSPHIPCHYTAYSSVENNDGNYTVTRSVGNRFAFSLGCPSVPELSSASINKPRVLRRATQTVTGYNLMTTGLGRVVDGAWKTATGLPWGILRSIYYGGKKAFNTCKSNQNAPAENAESRAVNRV